MMEAEKVSETIHFCSELTPQIGQEGFHDLLRAKMMMALESGLNVKSYEAREWRTLLSLSVGSSLLLYRQSTNTFVMLLTMLNEHKNQQNFETSEGNARGQKASCGLYMHTQLRNHSGPCHLLLNTWKGLHVQG
jgi:hypothetical protein